MIANTKSLREVITSAKQFEIPEYQRPYVWTKEEVEQLWDDLFESYKDFTVKAARSSDGDRNKTDEEKEAAESSTYFVGPIVVANQADIDGATVARVVDGQQRLTTLNALLWIICQMLIGDEEKVVDLRLELVRLLTLPNGKAAFRVAKADQANYQAIRENAVLDEREALGTAAATLREKVCELDLQNLKSFTSFILNKTRFVLVQTDSYSSAWELFIGLNGKGRPLSPADLIKAFVCGTHVDSAAIAEIWEVKVAPLQNDATSALLDSWRASTGGVGSDAKLFKLFEKAWDAKQMDSTFLATACEIYRRFWILPLEKTESMSTDVRRAVRVLRELDRRDISPLLIVIGMTYGFDKVFDPAIVRALESYQLWMAIMGKRGRERDFAALAYKTKKAQSNEVEFLSSFQSELARMRPSSLDVRQALEKASYPGRVMKLVVKSYEEGLRGDVMIDDVWYEHIMPKTPTNDWYHAAGTKDPNVYSRIVNNIGNIAPLDRGTNIKGSNDKWAKKRILFEKEVPNWLAARIARENPLEWTPTCIQKRAADIADWAISTRWDLKEALKKLG